MDHQNLINVLRLRIRGARRHRALALARPRTTSERAWQLICLGVVLRRSGDHEGALRALDEAVALNPELRAQRAAYLAAAAVHRDRGDWDAARRVSRSTPD